MAKTGVEPEITIISKLTNKNTKKKTERIALKRGSVIWKSI